VIPNFVWPTVQFSRSDEAGAGGDSAGVVSRARQTGAGRSLKTQQRVCEAREAEASRAARFVQARSTFLRPPALSSRPTVPIRLPRKEVIQPHLPVRLPCYDFTPITSPTFDGSLP
jgi:hypothetical protein